MPKLISQIRSIALKSGLQATVISVMQGKANVRLSTVGGRVLHGVRIAGGPVTVGQTVTIAYQDGIPYIAAGSENTAGGDTIINITQAKGGGDTPLGALDPLSAAGWTIVRETGVIYKNNLYIDPAGDLKLGTTDDDYARLSASDSTYRFWVGKLTANTAPFRVTKAGALTATSATITGTVQSSDFSIGVSGWQINNNGDAEFSNVQVRGAISAMIFEKSELQACAGTLGIYKNAGKTDAAFTTPVGNATPISMTISRTDGDSGDPQFANNDYLRIQTLVSGNVKTLWARVNTYTWNAGNRNWDLVTYTGWLGSTSTTFPEGTAVVNYGPSGSAFITLSADGTVGAAPNLSMATHLGSTTFVGLIRIGNLKSYMDYAASDLYGVAIGKYASGNPNITIDTQNGLRIRNYTTDVLTFDTSGNALISGTLKTASSPNPRIEIGASMISGYSDATTKEFWLSATDGKGYAGGGKVLLDSTGLTLSGGWGGASSIFFKSDDYASTYGEMWVNSDPYLYINGKVLHIHAENITSGAGVTSCAEIDLEARRQDLNVPTDDHIHLVIGTTDESPAKYIAYLSAARGVVETVAQFGVNCKPVEGNALEIDHGLSIFRDDVRAVSVAVGDLTNAPLDGRLSTKYTDTVTGPLSDGVAASIGLNPGYSADSAQTVTRHNYINIMNPTPLTNITLSNACVFNFNAAAGTHKALDSGTTKTSPGTVSAWVKINISGTIYYIPAYTSKTS